MIVADSSVWIGYLRRDGAASTLMLRKLLEQGVRLAYLPAILQEVLQGTRDDAQFSRCERLFDALHHAQVSNPAIAAREAARLYRRAAHAGYTIRSPVDCLIAASCVQLELPLLQRDRDFQFIAQVEPRLKLVSSLAA